MGSKIYIKLAIALVLMGIIIFFAVGGGNSFGVSGIADTRTGIDIKGGIYTILYPDLPEGQSPSESDLNSARRIIETRLDSRAIFDRNVTVETEHGRIIVEIPFAPGEKDFNPQKAVDDIGKTALLTFQEVDEEKRDEMGNYLPTGIIIIEGKQVKDAGVATNPNTGEILVTLELTQDGAESFEEGTRRLYGKPIAIFMDDQYVIAPVVNDVITDGSAQISGQRTAQEAGILADTIRAGALPFRLVAKELNSVSPILGEGALKVTIRAGIIAFILIALFMIVRYKFAGLVSVIALGMLVLATLMIISATGITLTLPGIAGVILTIGIGVDANVIIFERIKEELENKKTMGAALEDGFKRAYSAVVDSNLTTLLTAIILYWLGSGPIKGFAMTLGIGVVLSFLTAVTLTRLLLFAASTTSFFKTKKAFRI